MIGLLEKINRFSVKRWIKKNRKRFRFFGNDIIIEPPKAIDGIENMEIYSGVRIASDAWLVAIPMLGGECVMKIGEGTIIGHYNHIFATKGIEIGNHVITADKVYISDNSHSYEDISIPVLKQTIKQLGKVSIGDDSWLGENVCVLGSKIGKHCVIGANSVVTHDIPDYSVAIGAPAKVIKRYSFDTKEWEAV